MRNLNELGALLLVVAVFFFMITGVHWIVETLFQRFGSLHVVAVFGGLYSIIFLLLCLVSVMGTKGD